MDVELKKALQQEVLAAKARWGDEIKLSKAPSSSPTAPLPIGVCRTIARPASAEAYDVEQVSVQLRIDGPEAAPGCVRVEISGDALPPAVREAASQRVLTLWEGILTKYAIARPPTGGPFAVERVLAWCETKYVDLCTAVPEFVEAYDGVNSENVTIRRFTLVEPRQAPPSSEEEDGESNEESSGSDGSEEDTEGGDMPDAQREAERLRRIKIAAEAESERQFREERRREAEAKGGGGGDGGQQSAKKQAAGPKEKKGVRLRKQGAKANKYDAEAAGKKPNKKNGLMH